MDFPVSTITKPIVSKLVGLLSFLFARPRIDLDLVHIPESSYGQKSLGISHKQDHKEPIPIPFVVYDFEFYWNYKLRIKNNSSKTAFNIKIEKIEKSSHSYLQKLDNIASLKEGELIELDYNLKYRASKNAEQASQFLSHFPGHLNRIEILVSYTNESRKIFFTRFIETRTTKTNQHLFCRPK